MGKYLGEYLCRISKGDYIWEMMYKILSLGEDLYRSDYGRICIRFYLWEKVYNRKWKGKSIRFYLWENMHKILSVSEYLCERI